MTKTTIQAIIAAAVLVVLGITAFGIYGTIQTKRYEKQIFTSEHAIEKILDIEEIHMANYPYNGKTERIVTEIKNNGKTKTRKLYDVTYRGNVLIGTKDRITTQVDESSKTISVKIPQPQILDLSVDFLSFDYIFSKAKYDSETVSEDSYKLCMEDMKANVEEDEGLMKMARQNTERLVTALLGKYAAEYVITIE